ncbi:hypothetical protein AALP_AA1G255400 [Arabis alpina]|uniref:F-box domain-containing protein n=1 Tax=Arabis alpina TaxID=50452 RepID=A0A087HQM7_ARAAL|nr:hypothetical protein AALP_AA1G255400 [Arabis alpina]
MDNFQQMEKKNINGDIIIKEDEEQSSSSSINGDILVSILSFLPLLDLISASQVSKSWNRAVFFSLHRLKSIPWLFIYNQRNFPPYTMATTSMTYDPISNHWIKLKTESPYQHISVIRSSHSTLLYALSPAKFSFSIDAFHLIWRHVAPLRVWRVDPIVAVIGSRLVIAGGVNEFEDDRLAVELFDLDNGNEWERCESMPEFLYGSGSSTWLSVAVSFEKMYVTEKRSGLACCFDLETRSWTNLLDLCPGEDCRVYSRVIGFVGDRLIMAGITGDEDNPTGIEFWEVEMMRSIGSMPKECFDKLRGIGGSDWPLTSITMNAVGDMVYVYDTTVVGDIVAAEMEDGKLCKWRSLRNADAKWNKSHAVEKRIVACSIVDFSDLTRAFKDNLSFST